MRMGAKGRWRVRNGMEMKCVRERQVRMRMSTEIQRDLKEGSFTPVTNFESDKSAAEYANIYKEDGLTGGHVIMIGADPLTKSAAMEALHAYPGRQLLLSSYVSFFALHGLVICSLLSYAWHLEHNKATHKKVSYSLSNRSILL
ncbi:hypothetical protein RHMOL_Rhmol11G0060100 [Rhododendron molle]|uniref:Uncharacterized protein n=1 Tax=Rhododendron molle TaxID=49168 RepID=A0ACC0LPB2_RHOML|nr:hypothetical protein RHMOL_Rhmol11G0060100 [Rhododendron molle]